MKPVLVTNTSLPFRLETLAFDGLCVRESNFGFTIEVDKQRQVGASVTTNFLTRLPSGSVVSRFRVVDSNVGFE